MYQIFSSNQGVVKGHWIIYTIWPYYVAYSPNYHVKQLISEAHQMLHQEQIGMGT